MPAPLDVDLRTRVVAAYTNGEGTYDEIARRFVVSPASVSRYLRRSRESGSVAPRPATGGQPHRLGAAGEAVLRALVAEQPDAYCWELADRLLERTGVKLDEDTVGKALRRLGLTRKKRR
jgi:putative transposase